MTDTSEYYLNIPIAEIYKVVNSGLFGSGKLCFDRVASLTENEHNIFYHCDSRMFPRNNLFQQSKVHLLMNSRIWPDDRY